jgi:hypothetical protein
MENSQEKSALTKVKEPSKELLSYYSKLYQRNQSKWVKRSSLEPSHLGSEFEFEGKNLKLEGSVDSVLMIVSDSEGNYYRMHCNQISEIVTGKR